MLTRDEVKEKWIQIIESVHKERVFSSVEGAWQLAQWVEKISIADLENFHPRAMKLMRKKKPFIVIAKDEPYFKMAYDQIKLEELLKGTWTKEDEHLYQELCKSEE